jgi:MFS family permease
MSLNSHSLSNIEKRAAISIASLFALRMLGLFMIVPVFSLYAHSLSHATPFLIGIALGCYGLTQALLQIPFGMWSDHINRKSVIAVGFVLFAVGSLIAAFSHSIWWMIIGRSLQGAGAVGSATNALLADLTREAQRTKAMAIVGITIGFSFFVAMIIGPLFSGWFGVASIFWISTIFAVIGLLVLYFVVPSTVQEKNLVGTSPASSAGYFAHPTVTTGFITVLRQSELLRLNFGILFLHAIFTANFIALPFLLKNIVGLSEQNQWYMYLPVLLLTLICLFPLLRLLDKTTQQKKIFLSTISLLVLAEVLLWLLQHSIIGIAISLLLFFTGFTLLEALLPAAVSKLAPPTKKGTALGINSCYQFLGIFIGGSVGGILFEYIGINGVLLGCFLLVVFWLLLVIK